MGSISSTLDLLKQTSNKMFCKVLAVSALVALAAARPDGPPPPGYPPQPYTYAYAVKDDYSGANFNAQESADGKVVTGSYQVALPDGRIQTVTNTADHYNGYVADVKYSGEAGYPKYEPKPYKLPLLTSPPPLTSPLPKKIHPQEVIS